MEQKYRLPYGIASPKDSRGLVYAKFYEEGFKIGCSCEKNAQKRIKEHYRLLGDKIAEEVSVETRFHMHLEEKLKVHLREYGFCHHTQGTESFQYRDDIPMEDMRPLLKEIIENLNKDVAKMKNAHSLMEFVPSSKTKEELDMRTNKGKIEASIIDASNEQSALTTVSATEIVPQVKIEQSTLTTVSPTKIAPEVKKEQSPPTIAPEVKKEKLTRLYKTATGEKLHIITCSYLRQSKIPATPSDIKNLEICYRCSKELANS